MGSSRPASSRREGAAGCWCRSEPRRPGWGAIGSEEERTPSEGSSTTSGSAFCPFGKTSPAFRELGLDREVEWVHADTESCHPAPDGFGDQQGSRPRRAAVSVPRATALRVGVKIAHRHRPFEERLFRVLLGPLPYARPHARARSFARLTLATARAQRNAGALARHFKTEGRATRDPRPRPSSTPTVGPGRLLRRGAWLHVPSARTGPAAIPGSGGRSAAHHPTPW